MGKSLDKEQDRSKTRELILDKNRTPYSGGENWLGHGKRNGGHAFVDYLLLDGATMDRLLQERGGLSPHFTHLLQEHDLLVSKNDKGLWMFDREHLGMNDVEATKLNGSDYSQEDLENGVFIEGTMMNVVINKYERDPKARAACISHFGAKCSVCGFEFADAYGAQFLGFIHVHHLKMLSEIKKEYVVDPINDLRPVCPNCHAIIHKQKPPFTISQVKSMLKQ